MPYLGRRNNFSGMLPFPATVEVGVGYDIWFRASEMRPLAPSKDAQASRRRKGKKAKPHAPRQARATPARPPSNAHTRAPLPRARLLHLVGAARGLRSFPGVSARAPAPLPFAAQGRPRPPPSLPFQRPGPTPRRQRRDVTPRCLASLPVRAGGASQAAAMETGARPWVVGGCCRARLGGRSSGGGGGSFFPGRTCTGAGQLWQRGRGGVRGTVNPGFSWPILGGCF